MAVTHLDGRLDRALAAGVRAAYQPIVDLATGEVVAHEALARGPAGTDLKSPAALFAAAREEDRVTELDRACQRASVAGAPASGTLFVNVEPSSLGSADATDLVAASDLPAVLEVTERALAHSPGRILTSLRRARAQGLAIAVDDFGAEEAALALLPFLAPDVIKLDLSLVQDRPDADVARWVSAALAEAERSGATILAEGIETDTHLERARALGARLGQGWHLGRPAAEPRPVAPAPSWTPSHGALAPPGPGSPFDVVARVREVRPCTKPMLIALSHHLEALAHGAGGPAVVLGAFQHARHLTPDTRRRYRALAEVCAFTAAFGEGLGPAPVPGVRGAPLAAGDPLLGEWSVVVVGPHLGAALVARDLGDTGPEHLRRFDYAVTHDRSLAVAAAHTLLGRL